jgi:hypothetical protein
MFDFNFRCTNSSGAPHSGACKECGPYNGSGYMKVSKAIALLFWSIVLLYPLLFRAAAEKPQGTAPPSQQSAVPEMEKLAKALAGDWNTTETMELRENFPSGGSRNGIVHVKLAAGGTTLIYEVHSDGSAGKLDGMLLIWWDKDAGLYRVFVCFNNPNHPCEMRGTGHWEGDSFVNDYEETIKGSKTAWRDTFTFTPNSHTLVAAMKAGDGAMQTQITTKANRHHPVW